MTETTEPTAPASGTARKRLASGRSPSYPGIPLATAIERARTIWEREKRNTTPVRVMMKHWGYSNPKGGMAGVTFGALKKFGLVADEGTGLERPAKLTELAFEILNNPDPREAIRTAALRPPIHAEFWSEYGSELPSADSLKWKLLQRGFTESGATEFIREYRDTVAFARLDEGTGNGDADGDTADEEDASGGHADPPQGNASRNHSRGRADGRGGMSGDTLTIPVPVIGGSPVTIEGHFPISEAAWKQFIAVLEAMKPGLVAQPVENDDDE